MVFRLIASIMFQPAPALALTATNAVTGSILPLPLSTLNPLESALPQNQISCFANPIESTPFFQIVPIRAKFASVTPAYATFTEYAPRNPFRMNTCTKHQVATPRPNHVTNSCEAVYLEMNATWSDHSTHVAEQNSRPAPPHSSQTSP